VHKFYFGDAAMAIFYCTRALKTAPTYLRALLVHRDHKFT
jgi:hypothetical protein